MYKREVYKTFTLILQLGITVLVPIFLLIVFAIMIRAKFDIDLMLIFVVLGVLAGIRNVYVILKNYVSMLDKYDSKKSELININKRKRII